jgi:hypothetical protein
MCGEVMQWNADLPETMAERFINNAYRKIIDKRNWYGLLVQGEIIVPQVYTEGNVTFTSGSTAVVGVGTNFTAAMVGRQIRVGFTTPIMTIATVTDATHLTLSLPWGAQTYTNVGYSIFQQLVTFGYNIRRVLSVLNMVQGWQLRMNVPSVAVDAQDTWRSQQGFVTACVSRETAADGSPQYELYPVPTIQQSFPFFAYVQPPDMDGETNTFPYAWIRSDVIVLSAVADALLFRGKTSKYYDPHTAQVKLAQFAQEVEKMEQMDDNHYMKDLIWKYASMPYAPSGSDWSQSHDVDDYV